jgi:hypothetical protein
VNLYNYVEDNPLNRVDPLGLRDVFIAIWTRRFPYFGSGSVGHVAALEMDGGTILSQFPDARARNGVNTPLDFRQTVIREGRLPDEIFKVFVPDDSQFDAAVRDYVGRPRWDYNPNSFNETNCVDSVAGSLQAGGVPVHSYYLPGPLGDELNSFIGITNPGQLWSVSLSTIKQIPRRP